MKIIYSNLCLALFIMLSLTSAFAQTNTTNAIYAGNFGACGGNSFYDNRDLTTLNLGNTYGNNSSEIYYKITVISQTQLTVKSCYSDFNTKIYLINANGVQVATSSLAYCTDDSMETGSLSTNINPGTYYVVVEEANGGSIGYLNLAISCPPTGASPIGDILSAPIDAGIISANNPFLHNVNLSSANCYQDNNNSAGPDIYYKFTINQAATVTFSNCGSTIPTTLTWIDTSEDWIDAGLINGPVCPGQSVSFSMAMEPGTYLIRVEALDNFNQGDITTTISIGPPPIDPYDPGISCDVSSPTVECTPLASNISQDQNYILTTIVRRPNFFRQVEFANRKIGDLLQSIQYYDGLGRPMQNVQLKGNSTATKDIVQPVAYDQFGRVAKKYLPYAAASTADGSYKSNALSAGQGVFDFYNPAGNYGTQLPGGIAKNVYPFSETIFDAGPLSRPIEQGAPGAAWQTGGGHTVRTSYGTNVASEVRYWINTANGATGNAYYLANQLYKTTIKDENWKEGDGKAGTIEEFKTKKGHLVLKRTWETASKSLSTYYIYDEYGNLRYVLPPAINENGQNLTAFAESDDLFKAFIYAYHHDDLNRMTEKKIPGKGWEYFVYNKLDQLVFTQDAEHRKRNLWMVNRYDELGRQIITAIWNNNNTAITPIALSGLLDSYPLWDEKNNAHVHGYQLKSYPLTLDTILKVDYYDDYDIVGLPQEYNKVAQHSARTTGLATASKTLVLNGGTDMLWQVNYYDDKARSIRSFSQHYKGGQLLIGNYDEITNSYAYTNELLKSIRIHKIGGAQQLKAETRQVYDHLGNLLRAWQRINDGDSVLVVQNEYNDVGQLISKKLHGSAASGVQPTSDHVVLNANHVVAANQQLQTVAAKSITLSDGFKVENTGTFSASIVSSSFVQTIAYTYNERGWLKQLNDPVNVTNIESFGMEIWYEDHPEITKKQFNGNISAMNWQSKVPVGVPGLIQSQQSFDYQYDKLNRLSLANYTTTGKMGYFNEALSYDLMGNIMTLDRKANNTLIDQLSYTYAHNNQSNQLAAVNDQSGNAEGLVNGITNYTYDDNGSLVSDDRKDLQFSYNILNLPKLVKRTADNQSIEYIYDATGRKLRKLVAGGNRDYINGIEYGDNGELDFFQTLEGRSVKNGSSYNYEYLLKDHLGNTRVMIKQDGSILQVQDYYAFGLEMNAGNQYTSSQTNRYLYNGKEKQEELSLNQLDFGARFYNPVIGKWNGIDPLADKYLSYSTYNYVINNPLILVDPNGMSIREVDGGVSFDEEDAKSAFQVLTGKTTNVYMAIIGYAKDREMINQFQNKFGNGQWAVFGAADFNEANLALSVFRDKTINNFVLESHGSWKPADPPLIRINENGDLNPTSFIDGNDLQNHLNGNPVPEVSQLQSMAGKIKDGGNFIMAVCNIGYGMQGKAFASSLNKVTGERLNIYMPKNFAHAQRISNSQGKTVAFDGALSVDHDAGWLKSSYDGKQRHVNNIRLSRSDFAPVRISYPSKKIIK